MRGIEKWLYNPHTSSDWAHERWSRPQTGSARSRLLAGSWHSIEICAHYGRPLAHLA